MAKMTGKQAVMEMLVAEGVEYVFGNPGTSETPFMDALEDYPQLQYILALQEGSVIGMADGYARASGKPGFANVHIAAGLANAISMLYDAYRGGTSLVVTAGQSDTRMLMQHPTLSADLVEMTKQFTKWSVEVHHTEDIPMVMRRAFKVAKEPPTAPVFVSLPWNVLDETADVEIVPSPQKLYRPYPDPEAISKAVELLTRAKNPLLVIGDRISQSQAVEEMVNVAELLGVKVYTAARSEVNFPTDHPLSGGLLSLTAVQAKEMIRSSDLIFSVGSNLFTQFLYNPIEIPYEKTKIVHLDSSAWEIGRIYPAEVGIFCDLKPGLRELAKALDATLSSGAKEAAQTRMAKFAGEKKKAQERFESQAQASWDQVPISVPRLMLELRECLPEKTVIVDESITSGAALHSAINFSEPGSLFGIRGGAIGWGLPAALGVKLAKPDRPVVAVVGDGSAMYNIQALWSAAHHNIPVTYVICGNASYRILKVNVVHYLGEMAGKSKYIGMDLVDPALDFARMAQTFGLHGQRVEKPNDLKPALEAAIDASLKQKKASLVDVVIDGSFEKFF